MISKSLVRIIHVFYEFPISAWGIGNIFVICGNGLAVFSVAIEQHTHIFIAGFSIHFLGEFDERSIISVPSCLIVFEPVLDNVRDKFFEQTS